jgi:phosphoenolpyruvate carboxykinase (GTP)
VLKIKPLFALTEKNNVVCTPKDNTIHESFGNWISPDDYEKAIMIRFPGCMRGRTMYVVPFSMGPIGSKFSKIGVEITDSQNVVCSMKIMTRMDSAVLNEIIEKDVDFVNCIHTVGVPLSRLLFHLRVEKQI